MHKFFRPETGGWENVAIERWQWIAVSGDGTFLKQFDDSGIFHQFKEIDQAKLTIFSMVSGNKQINIEFKPDKMKLIHFYQIHGRRFACGQDVQHKLYCFGYAVNDMNHIFVILPDDNIAITDDADKVKLIL
jgi:hypothetical protein